MNTDFQIKSSDVSFVKEQTEKLSQFFKTKEKEYVCEPMNPYYRKLMHKLASSFHCQSTSAGEGQERHVVFINDGKAKIEDNFLDSLQPTYNFGEQLFFVDQRRRSVTIFLLYDGSVVSQIPKDNKEGILAEKEVTTGVFKIKTNRIIEKTDEQW